MEGNERHVFNEQDIEAVWEKALIQVNNDPNLFRKDYAGAWIKKNDYGKETKFGWEIDHINPIAKGGDDSIQNLCPLHWENNRKKGDDYPFWETTVTSSGTTNVNEIRQWRVNN